MDASRSPMEIPAKKKQTIYVTHRDNEKFFEGKLATFKKGYTHIDRIVTPIQGRQELYDVSTYGTIKVGDKLLVVYGSGQTKEVDNWYVPPASSPAATMYRKGAAALTAVYGAAKPQKPAKPS